MIDKEAIQYVISKVNNADEKGVELTEFDVNKVETLISIINRQQAEIEKREYEAIKEFVEKLKEKFHEMYFEYEYSNSCDIFDNLVKEMVGDDK